MSMTNSDLLQQLANILGSRIHASQENSDITCIEVLREDIISVIGELKNNPALEFQFLTDLCGIHYPDQTGRELGVVIHLHSFTNNVRLRVKSFFPASDPTFPSLTGLFAGANWMERETFDFFGIRFEGHPDLRRILNMDQMDYHPMLKEYALEDETRDDKSDKFFGR